MASLSLARLRFLVSDFAVDIAMLKSFGGVSHTLVEVSASSEKEMPRKVLVGVTATYKC